ncbi:probable (S)-N-methylcoclaurine 3'-hydroxylase isozyme 2 [Cynara cardunculus var. scolymus]|uniref:probable (S)-N-methylcoclaurine 3'-hydroxylase isozyme 2 n=1 Tax=Cynara cardunculus var. scolymus TaxID=59895 RepID=UPI000D62DC1E|nr:probable (S)-N-methylcoclaurine 3'-hydroxylase isozyme 2 [Cynara cardunculus var. scolymus]
MRLLREDKLDRLTDFLHRNQGRVINTETIVFTTLLNTLSCIVLGKDLLDLNVEHEDEHGIGGKLKESLLKINEYGGHVRDFGSFFPMFQSFDLQGIKRGSMNHMQKVFASWEDIITERRHVLNSGTTLHYEQTRSFVDHLLENGFSDNQINQLVTELFIAGTNTTTTAMVWTMTKLVRNKEVMLRLNEEMEKAIGFEKITESQLSKLPYLQACVKEALRLHPPVPFLLPHMAAETCDVMSYTIPKNARVFVNVWAIGRDGNVWEDPLSFRPERFLELKVDLKGHDFELLPFGSGRRSCPGLPSGVKSLEFLIASLIHEFDLVLPNEEDPTKIDMNEKFGLTLKKEKPLNLIFKRK